MKRIEIELKAEEKSYLERVSTSGTAQVRTLQRGQILLALDRGVLDAEIIRVLNIDRTSIWRIRKRYLEDGLEGALYEQARPGRPIEYGDKAEAELVAFACSEPPAGYSRWSIALLTEVARQQSHLLKSVSQSKVRQVLKKKGLSLG